MDLISFREKTRKSLTEINWRLTQVYVYVWGALTQARLLLVTAFNIAAKAGQDK